ncbi:MAG: hypothetical protein M3Y28_02095 [Armatimonadota bacterium]|nr:hypothetical protein [Armatimonadota bacterium]
MLTQPISGDEAVAARQVKNGAAWFHWIAGLTVLNVVTILCGFHWKFPLSLLLPIGLADTAHRGHVSGDYTGTLFATVFSVGIYLLLGQAAKKGARWAFLVGMIFYSLDTLLWIGAKEGRMLGLILHVVALCGMGWGLGAAKRWDVLRQRHAATVQTAAPAWSPTENDANEDYDDEEDEEDEELDRTPAPTVDAQAQTLEEQIQAQYREMQAQEAAAPPITSRVLPTTPSPQTPVTFSEIDALDTHIDAPDTKIGVPSTKIDSLDDGIDDRIDTPEV